MSSTHRPETPRRRALQPGPVQPAGRRGGQRRECLLPHRPDRPGALQHPDPPGAAGRAGRARQGDHGLGRQELGDGAGHLPGAHVSGAAQRAHPGQLAEQPAHAGRAAAAHPAGGPEHHPPDADHRRAGGGEPPMAATPRPSSTAAPTSDTRRRAARLAPASARPRPTPTRRPRWTSTPTRRKTRCTGTTTMPRA